MKLTMRGWSLSSFCWGERGQLGTTYHDLDLLADLCDARLVGHGDALEHELGARGGAPDGQRDGGGRQVDMRESALAEEAVDGDGVGAHGYDGTRRERARGRHPS